MRHLEVKGFEKTLDFFDWLDHNERACDACGVEAVLVASVKNEPSRFQTDTIRLCERCWEQVAGAG